MNSATSESETTRSPQEIILGALQAHDNVAISFSGAEDVVLIDMASSLSVNFSVFSLDTGRLHAETYRFIEEVRSHYGIEIDLLSPDSTSLAELVKKKGLFSFYQDGHKECCSVRKIEPLRKHLVGFDAWITGQRRDQSLTRAVVPFIQKDEAFSTAHHTLMKFNPLAGWSSGQVWEYIRSHKVPYNALHDRGFISIGCEPCTRAIGPGQHEREGRWWWEGAKDKECGLHIVSQDIVSQDRVNLDGLKQDRLGQDSLNAGTKTLQP